MYKQYQQSDPFNYHIQYIYYAPYGELIENISPYAYCALNPVKYVDLDGRSTHTNEDGLVVAVYDDNNLNIYKHSNAQLESLGDVYSNHLTAEGAEAMGKSLHAMSFADQSEYNKNGTVTHAKGMSIDLGYKHYGGK